MGAADHALAAMVAHAGGLARAGRGSGAEGPRAPQRVATAPFSPTRARPVRGEAARPAAGAGRDGAGKGEGELTRRQSRQGTRAFTVRALAAEETEAAAGAAPAAAEAAEEEEVFEGLYGDVLEGTFKLKFLWLEKNIGFAVDQVVGKSQHLTPVTEYFFWPRDDAWEELKAVLESKDWISEREKIELLNKTTEVINFWQDEETKHTIDEARSEFGDCLFMGA